MLRESMCLVRPDSVGIGEQISCVADGGGLNLSHMHVAYFAGLLRERAGLLCAICGKVTMECSSLGADLATNAGGWIPKNGGKLRRVLFNMLRWFAVFWFRAGMIRYMDGSGRVLSSAA